MHVTKLGVASKVSRVTAGPVESNGSLYRQVYDSRHLQADCQEPGSAPEPYARQSSMGYFYLLRYKEKQVNTLKKRSFTRQFCSTLYTRAIDADCSGINCPLTHTHPFNGPFSGSAGTRKAKPIGFY